MARSPGIVKIQHYQQRTNPSGPSQGFARAQELPNPFGGMLDGLAEGGAKFSDMMERGEQVDLAVERIEIARDEDDARAYSARAVADATARYAARAAEIESEAEDGWRGLTENSNLAWAEIDEDIIGAAPTEISRQYVGQHLGLLRAEMVARQAGRERDLRRGFRIDEVGQAATTWENVLLTDPTQWRRAQATMTQTIGSMTDITAADRREQTRRAQERLAYFAVSGMLERDPAGTMAQLQGSGGGPSADALLPRLQQAIPGATIYGSRTAERNAQLEGAAPNSRHISDAAWDITLPEGVSAESVRPVIEATLGVPITEWIPDDPNASGTGTHLHVAWGEGGGAQPPADSPFAYLSPEHRLALMRQQSTVVREQATQARALWEAGEQAPNAPSVEAVRLAQGDVAAADYEARQLAFSVSSGMQEYSNAQLMRIATAGPMPEGTERERLTHDAQRRAAAAILEQRTDPMAYIARRGNVDTSGMADAMQRGDWSEISRRLSARQAIATENGNRLGMPASPVTMTEARAFRGLLDGVRAQDRQAAFSQIRRGLSDPGAYANFANMVYGDAPGARLGMLVSDRTANLEGAPNVTSEVASRRLIDGALALGSVQQQNTPAEQGADRARRTIAMPSDADLRRGWVDQTGDAYRGMPDGEAAAFEAFRAAYAGTAIEAGDTSGVYNQRFAREAAAIASGGIADRGGSQTLLPWGMSETQFDGSIARGWNTIRTRNGGDLANQNPSRFEYVALGGGRYAVMTRQGAQARNSDGVPITIRIPAPR